MTPEQFIKEMRKSMDESGIPSRVKLLFPTATIIKNRSRTQICKMGKCVHRANYAIKLTIEPFVDPVLIPVCQSCAEAIIAENALF